METVNPPVLKLTFSLFKSPGSFEFFERGVNPAIIWESCLLCYLPRRDVSPSIFTGPASQDQGHKFCVGSQTLPPSDLSPFRFLIRPDAHVAKVSPGVLGEQGPSFLLCTMRKEASFLRSTMLMH